MPSSRPQAETAPAFPAAALDGIKLDAAIGHIMPAKNAERILQGIPGWEPIADGPGENPTA
jgi:hypothetical protein